MLVGVAALRDASRDHILDAAAAGTRPAADGGKTWEEGGRADLVRGWSVAEAGVNPILCPVCHFFHVLGNFLIPVLFVFSPTYFSLFSDYVSHFPKIIVTLSLAFLTTVSTFLVSFSLSSTSCYIESRLLDFFSLQLMS